MAEEREPENQFNRRMAFQRVERHHKALWEEEKHYSWWVYITLAGLIYIIASDMPLCVKIIVVFAGSILGLFVSIVGYKVVTRESKMYKQAMDILKKCEGEADEPTLEGISIRSWFRYTFVAFIILFSLGIIVNIVMSLTQVPCG